jgi:hypothetical protein
MTCPDPAAYYLLACMTFLLGTAVGFFSKRF